MRPNLSVSTQELTVSTVADSDSGSIGFHTPAKPRLVRWAAEKLKSRGRAPSRAPPGLARSTGLAVIGFPDENIRVAVLGGAPAPTLACFGQPRDLSRGPIVPIGPCRGVIGLPCHAH